MDDGDVQYLQHSPKIRSLIMGFQVMPTEPERPPGIGHERPHIQVWTHNGADISALMEGELFTDGSCLKPGPAVWNSTGWAVCKISRDGKLLASVSGQVGRQLPQTSPASEHVAALVAAAFPRVTGVYSDYRNLQGLELLSDATAMHPKGVYSGIRRQIRGISGPSFKIKYCKGHVSVESCGGDSEAIYQALGNQHADRVAGAAAAAALAPSRIELDSWNADAAFLKRWLEYVPRALVLWPTAKPSKGHKSLPRRSGARATQGCSFLSDVLGPWTQAAGSQTSGRAAASQTHSNMGVQSRDSQPLAGEVPAPPPPPRIEDNSGHKHEWHWQSGRWLCTLCLSSSRLAVPRRDKCPGRAATIRKLLEDPKGHKLQVATFTDGFGVLVICSLCGHCCASNRTGPLHKERCKARGGQATFASPGARAAYQRVVKGQHPKHGKGDARVLDPCISADALLALARERDQPTQRSEPP